MRVDFADDPEAEAHWEFLPVENREEAVAGLLESQSVEYLVMGGDRYNEVRSLQRYWFRRKVNRNLRVRIYSSVVDDWKGWILVTHESIRHKPSIRMEGVVSSGIYEDRGDEV